MVRIRPVISPVVRGVTEVSRRKRLNIAALFAAGEQGAWYDPSDWSTLYQDSAGTTPVTAVEQPVGLMLDKSQGLVLGPELWVVGQAAASITNVGGTSGIYNASTGELSNSLAGTSTYPRFRFTVGMDTTKAHKVRVVLSGDTTKIVAVLSNDNVAGLQVSPGVWEVVYNPALYNPAAFNVSLFGSGGVFSGVFISSVSVRELPGNHAYQTTSTSRPVLSARYNLLTKTEQFDDGAWTKSNATVTPNAAVAPDGAMTADKLVETATSGAHLFQQLFASSAVAYTLTAYLKASERNIGYIRAFDGSGAATYFDLSEGLVLTNAAGNIASIYAAGNGWYCCSVTRLFLATAGALMQAGCTTADNTLSYTGDGTSGIYIWGASLVPANQASIPYQRVNTSTDYDADPAKFKPYLKFDGVDDFLVTNSIDFTATDKMTVFAGVRKLSDAPRACVAELSNSFANTSVFMLYAPDISGGTTYHYEFGSKGTFAALAQVSSAAYAAPATAILTGVGDISGDQAALRVDGTQVASTTDNQGTGGYGNYPLYIGRRGGTSYPFKGYLYSLIVRGAQTSDTQVSQTETWVNQRTGAY